MSAAAILGAVVGVTRGAAADGVAVPGAGVGNPHRSPNLMLGLGVGYANHFGRTYEVDVVTGASAPPAGDRKFSENGLALNAFADFAGIDLGPGNLGVTAGVTLAVPHQFVNIALEPRYRWRFPIHSTTLRSIEPWAGLGVALAFRERVNKDYFLWLPLSAGCDFALGSERLYAGLAIDVNTVNPRAIALSDSTSGYARRYETRMDNVAVLLRLSYLVF